VKLVVLADHKLRDLFCLLDYLVQLVGVEAGVEREVVEVGVDGLVGS
jgi:hypothetical protein